MKGKSEKIEMSWLSFLIVGLALLVVFSVPVSAASYGTIIEGLNEIGMPNGIPGSIGALTTQPEKIVFGDEDSQSAYYLPGDKPPIVMAREYEDYGRVISIGHEGYFTGSNIGRYDNLQLGLNSIKWLDKDETKKILFDGRSLHWGHDIYHNGLINSLRAEGYTVDLFDGEVEGDVSAEYLANYGIYIICTSWASFTQGEIDAIVKYVQQDGGGLFLTGLGWSWVAYHPESTIDEYPMNVIATNFGMKFFDDIIHDPTNYDGDPSKPIFHLFYETTTEPVPQIVSVEILDVNDIPTNIFTPGDTVQVKATISNPSQNRDYSVSVSMNIDDDTDGTNGVEYDSHEVGEDWNIVLPRDKQDSHTWSWVVPSQIEAEKTYYVAVGIHDQLNYYDICYDCPGYIWDFEAALPDLTILPESWDFGSVTEGSQPKQTFTITNDGNADLVINDITPSCSCIGISDISLPATIIPGSSETFTATVDTIGLSGSISKIITVNSVDISVSGNVGLQDNLLKNPGFENSFSNWERYKEEGDVKFYIGASAHSGSKSGGIHIMSGGGWGYYYQEVPISDCNNIHAEVWAKLAYGGGDAELAVQTYDADDNLLDHEHKSVDNTEWTKISLDFSPDPNAVSAVVFLDAASNGEEYIIFDDAFLSASGPTLPSPAVSADTSSFSLKVGEFRDITFTVSNNGGDSDTESYLSVSASPGLHIEEWSSSSSDMNFKYSPIGSKIWNSKGEQITSKYDLLDAYEAYSAGETNTVTIKVKATETGSQWVKYRTAFDTLASGYNFIRNPTTGPQDQQKWHTYEIPAEVTDSYTLVFEGYDIDKEGELKMHITGYGDIIYLPFFDDLDADGGWTSCTVDITDSVQSGSNIISLALMWCSDYGDEKVRNVRIFKNDALIHQFNPTAPIGLCEVSLSDPTYYLQYEFEIAETPVDYLCSGPITIEMYAPEEIEKGGQDDIKILVKLPRGGFCDSPFIYRKGSIMICYPEEVGIASDPDLYLRAYRSDWDAYERFEPSGCDLIDAALKGLVGDLVGKFIPGIGFGTSVIEEAERCNIPFYDGSHPVADEWKNINEYDIYARVYDVGILGWDSLDSIKAIYPLKFDDAGEYKIYAYVDIWYRPSGINPDRRIGRELCCTVKVVE